jgi:hypothetical protein
VHSDVAALGALDHDVGLVRALKIGVGDVDDLPGDRVPDLHLPVGAIQRIAGVR